MKNLYQLFEFLQKYADKIDSAIEGTCFLYDWNGTEYVVLSDNTVITHEEDLNFDPIFP